MAGALASLGWDDLQLVSCLTGLGDCVVVQLAPAPQCGKVPQTKPVPADAPLRRSASARVR